MSRKVTDQPPWEGQTIETALTTALSGTARFQRKDRIAPCVACKAEGLLPGPRVCGTCRGSGRVIV